MAGENYLQQLKNSLPVIAANQDLKIVTFNPSLAKSIAACYFTVWGETFPAKFMYEPKSIIDYYTNKGQIGAFAVTPNNEVVGMFCAYPFHTSKRVYELGGLMVIPQYRGTVNLPLLIQNVKDQLQSFALDISLCQIVCHYTRAQEIQSQNLNQIVCGIELKAFNYFKDKNRLSTAYVDAVEVHNKDSKTVYLPEAYERIILSNYENFELDRKFINSPHKGSKTLGNKTTLNKFRYDNVLKLQLLEIGKDALGTIEESVSKTNADVFQISVPLEEPGCNVLITELNKNGYFFCSHIPLFDGRDCLILQQINQDKAAIFENIYLHLPSSQKLLNYIKNDFERVQKLNS